MEIYSSGGEVMIQIREPELRFKADDGSEFPEWEEKRLGELFTRIVEKNRTDLSPLTIIQGQGTVRRDESDRRIAYDKKGLKNYKAVKKDDFIVHLRSFEGGLEIANQDGIVSPAYHVYRGSSNVCSQFYYPYFRSNNFIKGRLAICVTGVRDGKNIEMDTFDELLLPCPSLPEQQKIVSFLSTIDEIITTTEAELTAWQERKKGVMQKIFNREVRFKADDGSEFPEWEERRIDSFSNCYAGATPSTKVAEYWNNGSIPWMSSGEVNNREIYETEKKISELGYEKSSTKMIKPNTVVIALAGQGKTRGMVAITRISVCTNQSLCAIETNDMVDDDYLYQYLITQYDNLRRISSGDGTRGGLNLQLVGEYKVFLPVLSEQKKIAECLSLLDDVINQIDTELLAWKEFKKGLLQQMFA